MTPRVGREPDFAPTVDPAVLTSVIGLLCDRAGLVFPANRQAGVATAIRTVMRNARIGDALTLVAMVRDDAALFDDLVAEVTIGETYFFRESAQFELIRNEIIPTLLTARPERRIRAWSAACASGEEAYSLAITLMEKHVPGDVLGTDISRPRLSAAHDGVYRKWSLRGVPDPVVERWFSRDGEQYAIAQRVKDHTTFGYLNLADDSYPALSTGVWGMDLILCRNALIYFDAPTIERVSRALLNSLGDDGWLLLGAADPALTRSLGAEVIETPAGLAYRRIGSRVSGLANRIAGMGNREPGTGNRMLEGEATTPDTEAPVPGSRLPVPETQPPIPHSPFPIPVSTESGIPPALLEPDRILTAYMTRDYESVVALVEANQAPDSMSTSHRVLLVRALANLGRLPEAGRACATALDAQRDVAELHYLHSVLLMESGRPADAAIAAKRALYLDRSMIVAHLAAATAASRSADDAAARRALGAAERLLATLPPATIVPASDGETAGRLLEMTRVQHRLLPAVVT